LIPIGSGITTEYTLSNATMHSNDPDRSSGTYLPRSLAEAYRLQFDRAFRYPFSVPFTLLGNAVLTAVLWFWSPRDLFSVFFNVNELFFFPMVLASWMVSDVPATNEYAPDAQRILAALDDPTMLTRLLRAKHLVLWTLISPVAFVTAPSPLQQLRLLLERRHRAREAPALRGQVGQDGGLQARLLSVRERHPCLDFCAHLRGGARRSRGGAAAAARLEGLGIPINQNTRTSTKTSRSTSTFNGYSC
jgi:hypothetical protein